MDKMDKEDKMKHILKARQFRNKLRKKKAQEEKKNRPEEKPEEEKPSLLPSELNPAENPIEEEKKEDPLNFFNEEHNKEEKDKKNEVLNEVLKMIEGDDKKEEEKKKEKKSSDSESNSSSESVEENLEEQRLLNMKKTQDKLFANKNNRVIPVNDLFKQKRNSEEIPKDKILEKFNINREEELPELNEDENEEEIDEAEEKEKNEIIELNEEDEKGETDGKNKKKECKRSKEKRIGYIVRKVFEWKGLRKLSEEKISLQDAAKSVGLSKKTLDEYFNQIKEGNKYGFDFNKYKKDKVNVLRGFVKQKKAKDENENKVKK